MAPFRLLLGIPRLSRIGEIETDVRGEGLLRPVNAPPRSSDLFQVAWLGKLVHGFEIPFGSIMRTLTVACLGSGDGVRDEEGGSGRRLHERA